MKTSMSRHTLRPVSLCLCLALCVGLVATGCHTPPDRLDEKFRHTVSETFEEPAGVVVDLVDSTVETLRLQIMSRALTSIDGRIEVRSAMGDHYRVVVEGLKTNRCRVAIDMAHRRNEDQAKLILNEISSRIRSLRSRSTSTEVAN